MTRQLAWATHVASLLAAGSGLLYAWMLFLVEPVETDEFGLSLVNHPWQPSTLAAHVVLAPVLVFLLGYLWPVHVGPRIRGGNPRGRRVGLSLALLLIPMIASGYLLQVSVDEGWREIWSAVHVASSLLWCVLYLIHAAMARFTREAHAWDAPNSGDA